MQKKYVLKLTEEERRELWQVVKERKGGGVEGAAGPGVAEVRSRP